jgi:hypothetical protein
MVADYKHVDSESGKAVRQVALQTPRYGDASNGKKGSVSLGPMGVAWPGIRQLALWQRGLANARYERANVFVATMCSGG